MKSLKYILLINILILSLSNAISQECCIVQRDIKSYEDWYELLDSLFRDAIVDSNDDAYAVLKLKVDSLGFIRSMHISSSRNMDHSLFYKISSKIEDCYSYSFLIKEYHDLNTRYNKHIPENYVYMQYLYSFHFNDKSETGQNSP